MVQYPAPWGGKGEQSEFPQYRLARPSGTFIMRLAKILLMQGREKNI